MEADENGDGRSQKRKIKGEEEDYARSNKKPRITDESTEIDESGRKRKVDDGDEGSYKKLRMSFGTTELAPPIQETAPPIQETGCSENTGNNMGQRGNIGNNMGQRGQVFNTSHVQLLRKSTTL